MNTLPNTPSRMASPANSVKYSHPMPEATNGWQMLHASSTNMPPTKPIISTAYRTKNRMVEALERGLFFFAS